MKAALLAFTITLCRSAESPLQGLKTDLDGLRKPGSATYTMTRQVGMHTLLLAEKTHEPSAPTLRQFSGGLVMALSGRSLTPEDIDRLAGAIERTMQSAGTSTVDFLETIRDFEARLTKTGVPSSRAHQVATTLEKLGREVQGPEDTPVLKPPRTVK